MKVPIFSMVHLKRLKMVIAALLVLAVSAMSPAKIHAQSVVFSDDFSQGITKWQPTRDDGTMWQIINGAIEATVTKKSTITELVPKDQYWNKEWKNITFSYDLTPLQGVDRNTSFGWESLQRWFELHFVNGILNLVRVEDGTIPLDMFEQYPMVNGQTYHIVITLKNQQITVKVNDVTIADTSYSEYVSQGGKIGLKAGTGSVYPTKLRYDNVEVRWDGQDSTTLSVPHFKQIDPKWIDLTYDHATAWAAQPTIGRYGCLISSIAMVMNYHGLNKMVDGSAVTPATLNTWLTLERDGYIGEGMVNWSAVTRLTKQLSDKFGTPKLEYSRIPGDGLTATTNFIKQNRPSILEVTGHFLVGKGFTADQKDLLINDPAYTYDKLSQHKSSLLSTRLLTPSQTDLSYLVISYQEGVQVALTKSDGSSLSNLETFTESLTSFSDQPQTTSVIVQQIAKPDSGSVLISISQPQPGPFKLTIFAYDVSANLTDLSISGWAGPTPQTYTIDYKKEAGRVSTIEPKLSWDYFKQVLSQLNTSGSFLRKTIHDQLTNLVDHAEAEPKTKQLQRVKQLEKVVTAFGKWLTPHTQSYLLYLLSQLDKNISNQ